MPRHCLMTWVEGKDGILYAARLQFNCPKKELPPLCDFCGFIADFYCDFKKSKKRTCDKKLCLRCRNNIGVELDLCSDHFEEWKKTGSLEPIKPDKKEPYKNKPALQLQRKKTIPRTKKG